MRYNLGGARSGVDARTAEDIDRRVAAAVLERIAGMQEDLARYVAPLVETIRSLQPVVDSFQKTANIVFDAVRFLYERMPQNWPAVEDEADVDKLFSMLEDGIPIAYIPGRETVAALALADGYDERVAVLIGRKAEVIDECRTALDAGQVMHPAIKDARLLVHEALTVLEVGYHASAQTLGVAVCDSLIRLASPHRKYNKMVEEIKSTDPDEAFYGGVYRFELSLRPVVEFLAAWRPESDQDPPIRLSRHRTTHGPTSEHLWEGNAIIAVMLASSLLLGVNEWSQASDKRAATGHG